MLEACSRCWWWASCSHCCERHVRAWDVEADPVGVAADLLMGSRPRLCRPSPRRFARIFSPEPAGSYYRRINTDNTSSSAGDETHRRASDSVHAEPTATPTAAP